MRLGDGKGPRYSIGELRRWSLIGEDRAERAKSLADPVLGRAARPRRLHAAAPDLICNLGDDGGRVTERSIAADQEIVVVGEARARTDAPGSELAGVDRELFITVGSAGERADRGRSVLRREGMELVAGSVAVAVGTSQAVKGWVDPSWVITAAHETEARTSSLDPGRYPAPWSPPQTERDTGAAGSALPISDV